MITKQDLELVHLMADDFQKKHGLQVSNQLLVLLGKLAQLEQDHSKEAFEKEKQKLVDEAKVKEQEVKKD